jgi:hypothetical protein
LRAVVIVNTHTAFIFGLTPTISWVPFIPCPKETSSAAFAAATTAPNTHYNYTKFVHNICTLQK